MGLARGRGRGKGRGGVFKPKSRGIAVKPPPLLGRPAPIPPMALRPRGLSVPPILPRMGPPPHGLRPSRGIPHAPPPQMFGPGRPVPPPYHPPPPLHPPHVTPLMPLRPPIPPPSLLRPRGALPIHSGTYPTPMSSRGKFGGKRGGAVGVNIARGGKRDGKGKKKEFFEDTSSKDGSHYCETCDRSFRTEETLAEHLSQHQICGLDGCQFTAHAAVVTRHVQMQHATGLYSKISAVTDKPEDIAKWISERKKRYPTKENIEKQRKEREEKIKRGERLEDQKTRFNPDFSVRRGRTDFSARRGRTDFSARRGRTKDSRGSLQMRGKRSAWRTDRTVKTKPAENGHDVRKTRPQISATSLYQSDEDGNKKCRGKLPAFLGTVAFSNENGESEDEKEEEKKFSDDEWNASQENKTETKDVTGPIVTVSTVLSDLMGMYASGTSDSEGEGSLNNGKNVAFQEVKKNAEKTTTETALGIPAESSSKVSDGNKDCKPSVTNDSEDSGPEEVPIVKTLETTRATEKQTESEEQQQQFVQSTGRKRKRFHKQRGSKQKFRGKTENEQSVEATEKPQAARGNVWHLRRRRLTLLEKLLSDEIRHERNVILQCVRYMVNENFFDVAADTQKLQHGKCTKGDDKQDEEKRRTLDRILRKLETVRQCNHYVVKESFFGVPCSEGINCDEDEDN